jgi:uncharacterized protein YdcH (DUF465 family)
VLSFVYVVSSKNPDRSIVEERMASIARSPRDILLETDAEYQRLAEQHSKYQAELNRISTATYLSSEDLLEEIRLKKLKLHIKDEMELLAARLRSTPPKRTQ